MLSVSFYMNGKYFDSRTIPAEHVPRINECVQIVKLGDQKGIVETVRWVFGENSTWVDIHLRRSK